MALGSERAEIAGYSTEPLSEAENRANEGGLFFELEQNSEAVEKSQGFGDRGTHTQTHSRWTPKINQEAEASSSKYDGT